MIAQDRGGCDLCGPTGATQNQAVGNYSVTAGVGNEANGICSMAVGQGCKTVGASSFALGRFLRANATNAIVIGGGTDNSDAKALTNSLPGTLMVGFNSQRPTLFVSCSNGGISTGKIGIGNITNPKAKIHLLSDNNEDAGLILETSNKNSKNAYIQLYDVNHKIEVSNKGMNIVSTNDNMSIDAVNIRMNGKVGINIDNGFTGNYDYALAVNGGVLTSEVFIKEVDEWHDDVFDDDYELMSLDNLEQYIEKNRHLPEIPSETSVLSNGYALGEMNGLLLKKIEELTLYIVDLQKQLRLQEDRIQELEKSEY
ncbi:MAG: hypothetical protein ACI358_02140 [Candidatus Limimorpha sp.]